MLKKLIEKWNKNKNKLREELSNQKTNYEYKDLVKLTFEYIYNDEEEAETYPYGIDIENIREVDIGDYQGTLIYIIPFGYYQPDENEFLLTYVDYGSCSCCDTLLSIIGYMEELPNEVQLNDLMTLCLHIIQRTIKPFGDNKDEWEQMSIDKGSQDE